jgi:predicted membrane protein
MIWALAAGVVLTVVGLVRRDRRVLWVGIGVLVAAGLIILADLLFFE